MRKITLYSLISLSFLFFSCSKEDGPDNSITVQSSEKTLYFGDEYQIKATSNLPISYTSNDEYHAAVSETGLVTARFVGETEILLSNGSETKEVPVTVEGKSNLYPKPHLDFGISRSKLIGELGTPDAEIEEGVGYGSYSSAAPMIMYLFDENDNLRSVGVLVSTVYSSDLGTFLSERYLPADPENLIFINALEESRTTMLVAAELYDQDYWMVLYIPYSSSAKDTLLKRNSFAPDFNDLYRELRN